MLEKKCPESLRRSSIDKDESDVRVMSPVSAGEVKITSAHNAAFAAAILQSGTDAYARSALVIYACEYSIRFIVYLSRVLMRLVGLGWVGLVV